ncbi:MAG: response regulator [Pseudonocardiaceae bacterium]|nr:response regulator [Pseudonocardiaceae bacterium]
MSLSGLLGGGVCEGGGVTAAQRPVRVVLADDESLVLDGLTAVLEPHPDIDVVGHACDGDALLALVYEQYPDVVLLDVRMPGMDGLTALRWLPAIPPPYCAVLTTFDLDSYVDEALRAGAHGFLLKDTAPAVLANAVRDLAAGGAVIDPRIAARLLPRLRTLPVSRGFEELSQREREVLMLLGQGASNATIGRELAISESTVKGHVTHVLVKLAVENRVQAALIAKRLRESER